MEKEHFDSLIAGLEEAAAYVKGDKSHCREIVVEVPDPVPTYRAEDVARMRKALCVSQRRLALALGVSTRTVEAWEAGRNQPSGTAQRLLYLLDGDHALFRRLVPALPPDLIV